MVKKRKEKKLTQLRSFLFLLFVPSRCNGCQHTYPRVMGRAIIKRFRGCLCFMIIRLLGLLIPIKVCIAPMKATFNFQLKVKKVCIFSIFPAVKTK